ncbi:reverse transcriptase family protein [Acinetobacter baumannii]|uniref:reverse transcriptase family protein n=2 Tax=Acinetobacter baumannii TaxID=470 RepID=UPI0007097545|nr:reverse transcriptase family protein [Acinetobacter baumannii]EKT8142440.1 RNA-directed DNA polymerase [Acinetobacter baumannii]EKU7083801.1 RNA-directed DNA polymerase [Acinetobacter baumannii]EKV1041061.1 RNA-directed DNA polymerase [Acinetobacter baumannii]EKV1044957.1 RNA-directed DNA polymerase [Acinetobacter baumannii]EKV1918417.1 RNA-directed DNA polymerase [Acinetobacter baumannii]
MSLPENYLFRLNTANKISSLNNLAKALGVQVSYLRKIADLPDEKKYEVFSIKKNDGRERLIHKPCKEIRNIQRRINHRIFKPLIIWPTFLYGSIPAEKEEPVNDYINCAKKHCLSKSVLKLDIKDFFDNIDEALVKNIFRDFFKYSEAVSNLLTKICCVNGHVPQGALTSSYIASLCLYSIEPILAQRLNNKKLKYTRYVDDITISTKKNNYDFNATINIVEGALNSIDLPLNIEKIKVEYFSTKPIKVHNLRIDFKTPRYDKDEARKIRSAIDRLVKQKEIPNYRSHYFYRADYNRCIGLINKINRLKHPSSKNFLKKILRIKPLPNPNDLDYVRRSIFELSRDYAIMKNSYQYRKKFFRIQQRLIFIRSHPQMIYENSAQVLNSILQKYRPLYEEK